MCHSGETSSCPLSPSDFLQLLLFIMSCLPALRTWELCLLSGPISQLQERGFVYPSFFLGSVILVLTNWAWGGSLEFIPHKLGPRAPCDTVCMLVPLADSFFFPSQGQMVGSVGESSNRCEELCSGCGGERQRLSLLGNIIWPVCTSQNLAKASLVLTKATFHT